MVEPYFKVENEFSADMLCFASNSIFAFDIKEQVYWIGNIINSNQAKKIPLNMAKSSFIDNKISLCRNLPYFALVSNDESSVRIIDATQDKTIQTLQITDSKIECVSISDDGKSLLIGGKNGILTNWDIYSGKLLNIPARHKDFVLLARESPNKRFVVSIGYDRSILFFDKHKHKSATQLFNANNAIKCAKFFADSSILVLGDIAGIVYVIDTHTQTMLRKFQATHAQVIDICYYKDSYIFVLGSNGVLCLCDFSSGDKVMSSLSEMRYKSFVISDNSIILASANCVLGYKFSDFVDYCKNLIAENNILEAYKFANIYKFLRNESFYLALEAKFEADILEAKMLVCSGNRILAEEILRHYEGIPSKIDAIATLQKQMREIDEFSNLMEKKLEIRAIPMAQNNPLIRELKIYKDFEERFLKIILLVKELAKKGKKDDANVIIMPYKKIPSKVAIIQEVLLYPQKVDEALEAIESKDYRTYFKLKKTYRFVSILDKSIEEEAESLYFKALNAFYMLNVKECRKFIAILKNFRQYREFALGLEMKIDEALSIISKIGGKEIKEA